jgi:hypothetical protein
MATKERRSFDAKGALRAMREFAQQTWQRMVKGGGEEPATERAPAAPSARPRPELRPVGEGATYAAGEKRQKPAVQKPARREAPKRAAAPARKPAEAKRETRAAEKPTEAMAKAAAEKARARRAKAEPARAKAKPAARRTAAEVTERVADRRGRAAKAPGAKPIQAEKPPRSRRAAPAGTTPGAAPQAMSDQERWSRYMAALPDRSRRFLELLEQRKTLSTDEMIDVLGLEGPRTVGGVIGGIRRWAPLHGITPPFDAREDEQGNRVFHWTGR